MSSGGRLVRSARVLSRRTAFGLLVRTVEGPLVALEGSGAALWDELADPAPLDEIAVALAGRFDAPVDVVAADIMPALDELLAGGLVETVA